MSQRKSSSTESARAPSQRQLRVGEEIRHALSEAFMRADFRDPDLQGLNVTVAEVRVSPDLQNATAFVMPLGGGDVTKVVAGLNRAAAYVRSQVASRMQLRRAPRIDFKADLSFERAEAINRLLHRPDVAADLKTPDDEDPADGT